MVASDDNAGPVIGLVGESAIGTTLVAEGFDVVRLGVKGETRKSQQEPPRLIILSIDGADTNESTDRLRAIRSRWPMTDCLGWAPGASAALVRELLRGGARDVVIDGEDRTLADAVRETLDEQRILPAVDRLAEHRVKKSRFEGMLSRNHTMWDLFETVTRVASTDANVLVCGETGTGKELFARALHRRSGRKGRFVALNCSALPEHLVESELFGHEKGAFTGAAKSRLGIFRHAEGGTVFLDEIGDMSESAQQNLLRVIEERRVRPVGSSEEIEIDVRIVAATHVPLEQAVAANAFREDLFYRLDVIRLDIPPLRERPEDIVYLFGFFLKSLAEHYGVDPPRYTERFIDRLTEHGWPGNVRELENFAERVVLRARRGILDRRDFDRLVRAGPDTADATGDEAQLPSREPRVSTPSAGAFEIDVSNTLRETVSAVVDEVERAYLEALLRSTGGRMQVAADRADISRRTLLRKLRQHEIDRARFRE